jgi:hypothetical protein
MLNEYHSYRSIPDLYVQVVFRTLDVRIPKFLNQFERSAATDFGQS